MVYLLIIALVAHTKHPGTPSRVVQWHSGVVTTYARHFENRPMANGHRFHHRDCVVACRGGRLGQRVELRYGKNGRAVAWIADRGKLPLHRNGQWQFDVSQKVARQLGLYKLTRGKQDRRIRWRFL